VEYLLWHLEFLPFPGKTQKEVCCTMACYPERWESSETWKRLFFFGKYEFWDATDCFYGKMLLISVSQFENWRSDDQFCILSSEQNWHYVLLCVWTAGICYKHNFCNASGWLMRTTMVESWTPAHLVHITNAILGW